MTTQSLPDAALYDVQLAAATASRTTGSTTRTFSYDVQRRPTQVSEGGTTLATFAYDGDGVRRKRTDSTGTVHYVSKDYERRLADALGPESTTTYYRALGRLIALRKDGQLRWVGTDHLGSTARLTDSSFAPLDQQRYTPYGGRRNSPPEGLNLGTDQRFTGQTEDSSIGLYWYASRAYDPALGRFLQPDTIVPNPANPQDLNRYSYVRNNPVKYSDPTGHDPWAQGLNETAEIEIQSEPLIFLPPEPTKPNIFINTNPGGGAWIFVGPESSQPNIFVPPQPTGPITDSFPEQGGGVHVAGRDTPQLGDLTNAEVTQIREVVDDAGRPLEVVGSAASGTRRGVGTDLPIGKGPGTRSDIDYLVPPGSVTYYKQGDLIERLPPVDPKFGVIIGTHNPHMGPAVRFEPEADPTFIPMRID